jgi:hypothetical protein
VSLSLVTHLTEALYIVLRILFEFIVNKNMHLCHPIDFEGVFNKLGDFKGCSANQTPAEYLFFSFFSLKPPFLYYFHQIIS